MQTMHPTLLIGPYDWEPERFPKTEFEERIAALWARLSPAVRGVLIYADPRHNSELAYYTNYVPRLEPALALISRDDTPIMLPSDPPSMWGAAKRLTWVEEFAPLKHAHVVLAEWKAGATGGPVTTLGFNAMPPALHRTIAVALGGMALPDATPTARELMRVKRPREVQALRDCAETLKAASDALRQAQQSGANAAAAVLETERAALTAGAQDARILYSVDGGRSFRPFADLSDVKASPLLAYIAVRRFGYWTDGFVTADQASTLHNVVRNALQDMIANAKAGSPMAALASHPFPPHAMTRASFGAVLGTGLEDDPLTIGPRVVGSTSLAGALGLAVGQGGGATDDGEQLQDGAVYSLRVGTSENDAHALASAIVLVREGGNEVLWTSP